MYGSDAPYSYPQHIAQAEPVTTGKITKTVKLPVLTIYGSSTAAYSLIFLVSQFIK